MPTLFRELGVDCVLLGGDFSTTAMKEEFIKAKEWVDQIEVPWIAIPGNHDCYTKKSCRAKDFYRYLPNRRATLQYPVEFFTLKDHRIEAHKLQEGWWLIALDTALATRFYSSEGLFTEQLENYLGEVLRLIPGNDSVILLNHYPFLQNDVPKHSMIRGENLQRILEKNPQIRMYLHGHTHRHTIADLQINNLPIVLDSGSSAQGKQGSWNLIDIDEKGCRVSTYRWDDKWRQTKQQEFQWMRSPGFKTV